MMYIIQVPFEIEYFQTRCYGCDVPEGERSRVIRYTPPKSVFLR